MRSRRKSSLPWSIIVADRFPIDRLITFYDFVAINHAAADAVSGAALRPALRMP
jgi:hypothetical protein